MTKWSKLDTQWKGVTIDALLDAAFLDPPAPYVTAFCDGGYTMNLALEDLLDGRGLVAYEYDGAASRCSFRPSMMEAPYAAICTGR